MSVQLLRREYVWQQLQKKRCRFIKEYETSTAWETASGAWFSLPHENPDKRTAKTTLDEILRKVDDWNLFTGTKRPEKGQ
jgi:hypothetical protein